MIIALDKEMHNPHVSFSNRNVTEMDDEMEEMGIYSDENNKSF